MVSERYGSTKCRKTRLNVDILVAYNLKTIFKLSHYISTGDGFCISISFDIWQSLLRFTKQAPNIPIVRYNSIVDIILPINF